MVSVFTKDFERWADSKVGPETLGEFIQQLVHARVPLSKTSYIRFLSEEASNLSSWDGLLNVQIEDPFIPNGQSVWEISGQTNPTVKIRKDYVKRLDKPLPPGWSQNNTTYVAVTLRKLDAPEELAKDLLKDSPWKNVMVIDSEMLRDWVSLYPSVESWLHEHNIGSAHTIKRLSVIWDKWSSNTRPSVSPSLLLNGRGSIASELPSRLLKQGEVINIKSDSPEEVVGFIHAAISQVEEPLKSFLLARSIVVENIGDIDRLITLQPQVVILIGNTIPSANAIARAGHTVLCAIDNSSPSFKTEYVLGRGSRDEFKTELMNMGIEEIDASVQARACGASASLWRVWNQLHYGDPESIPEWTRDNNPSILLPAVMMGGWSEKKEGDINIVEHFTTQGYDTYKESLEQIQHQNHPPLAVVGDVWSAVAPAVSFAILTPKITSNMMNRFTEVVKLVFSELDPTLDLSPDERPYASLHNKEMKYSSWLRDGLAETILRIAVVGGSLDETGTIPGRLGRQDYVNNLINQLDGLKTDWRLMTSLRDQLPVLAEAAPIPFFEALEELIQGQSEDLVKIFEEGESGFGHSFHHNFLWALERLAWNPAYLMRTSKLLMSLSMIDPGGRTQNRPINSLKEIFLPWKPDTSAELPLRQEVLTAIIEQDYEFGWELLKALLPSYSGVSSPTNKPQWRDFGQTDRNRPTRGEVSLAYDWLIGSAISLVGYDVDRLLSLLNRYSEFSPERQLELNEMMVELSKIDDYASQKVAIWKALRDIIYRHRSHKDAPWAMSDEVLNKLENLLRLFEPVDKLESVKWLFDDHYPSIPIPSDDFESIDAELKRLRFEAVKEVYEDGGVNAIIDLADNIQFVYLLANPLSELLDDPKICLELVRVTIQGDMKRQNFASSLSEASNAKYGSGWNEILVKAASEDGWPPEAIAQALLYYPDSHETYDLVEASGLEVTSDYWNRKHSFIRSDDEELVLRGITHLNEVGRYLDIIGLTPKKIKVLSTAQMLELLDNAVLELNAGGEFHRGGDIGYYIELLINYLRDQSDCPVEDLAKQEYRYLTLLTRGLRKPSLAIHKLLAEDPEFFIQVICDLYKPESASDDEVVITDEINAKASQARKLLQSWGTPPGIDDGKVNAEKLSTWVRKAIELAAEVDRLEISKEHIGKSLYYLPVDTKTGSWPCDELSSLLEALHDDSIEDGIFFEQINRGGTSRAMFEGGKQERLLAEEWGSKLGSVNEKWVRMRNLIQRIADYWKRDAEREDERAEKDRLRFN